MRIELKQIELQNWQGGNGVYDFHSLTNVSADNGKGKSRLYRAFLYCLFGKDDNGKSDFDVFTIENGEYTNQDAIVSCILVIDGEEHKLTMKTLQKRDKKGGYKGSTTNYYLNDVPFGTKTEYQNFIKQIIDEDVFRIVTNPTHFLSLPWKEQREKLFQLANVDDNDIQGYENLKNMKFTNVDDYRKSLISEKNRLNKLLGNGKDRGELAIRIEQTRLFITDETHIPEYEEKKDNLVKEIADIDKAIEKSDTSVFEKLQDSIMELESKKIADQQKQLDELNSQVDQINAERRRLQADKGQKETTLQVLANKITLQQARVLDASEKLQQARANYQTEYKQKFIGQVICPITSAPCEDGQVLGNANANFITAQTAKLAKLADEGRELKSNLEKEQAYLAQLTKDKAALLKSIDELGQTIAATPEQRYKTLQDIQPNSTIQQEIDELQKQLQSLHTADNSELLNKRNELETSLKECELQLQVKDLNQKYRDEIAQLLDQQSKCVDELFAIQAKIDEVDNFFKQRIELNTANINSMFNSVQFQLYKQNLVGTSEECCIARNLRGVKVSNTNTAEKIQIGLEIIRVIANNANISVPIFIDNRESISTIPDMNCQIINLYKTNDDNIKISYE